MKLKTNVLASCTLMLGLTMSAVGCSALPGAETNTATTQSVPAIDGLATPQENIGGILDFAKEDYEAIMLSKTPVDDEKRLEALDKVHGNFAPDIDIEGRDAVIESFKSLVILDNKVEVNSEPAITIEGDTAVMDFRDLEVTMDGEIMKKSSDPDAEKNTVTMTKSGPNWIITEVSLPSMN